MFTIKERCTLKPLATSGPFAKPFVVEVSLNLLNLKKAAVSVFVIDDDGTEKKLAAGDYELKPEIVKGLKEKVLGEGGKK